jgi:purine-nucleoside phosphorylase
LHGKRKSSRCQEIKGIGDFQALGYNLDGGKMNELLASLDSSVAFIQKRTKNRPKIAFILGSGLSAVADSFEGVEFSYSEIPGMPQTTVSGHRGVLKIGKDAVFFMGRFHFYEGFSLLTSTFPVLLSQRLGVEVLVLTNSAGGINPSYSPGDLVLIQDHINLLGQNPFIGPHEPALGPRFFDMTEAYDKDLRQRFKNLGLSLWGKELREGVYVALSGPSYETPAEIKFLKTIGADLVGMSTVPEVLVARSLALRVGAISTVSNLAAGLSGRPLKHEEVLENSRLAEKLLVQLLTQFLAKGAS